MKSQECLIKSQKWLSHYSARDEITKIADEISRMPNKITKNG
jgi:hypothetical protein